ncbi:MAG: SLBB domain-containing protein [Candidatus Fermentibacteria bacterium]
MRVSAVFVIAAVFALYASGLEGYTVPGVENNDILMSIHVWGEVRNPGTYLVPVDADLIAGISSAGGPTSRAKLSDVSIVYEDREIVYNLDRFLDADGGPVPDLLPGATIYIPTSSFEWWKTAIDFSYKIIIAVNLIWIMSER